MLANYTSGLNIDKRLKDSLDLLRRLDNYRNYYLTKNNKSKEPYTLEVAIQGIVVKRYPEDLDNNIKVGLSFNDVFYFLQAIIEVNKMRNNI
tara:strand:+ start:480 stop:755 length:276 start_codon:yes stop_codon:yes gene_type:complete